MSPKKTPQKIMDRKLIIDLKKTDADDVAKELDDFREKIETRLHSIQQQIDEIKERLSGRERNGE